MDRYSVTILLINIQLCTIFCVNIGTLTALPQNNINQLDVVIFDPDTNQTISKQLTINTRQRPFLRRPCSCLDLNCGCCAGFNFQRFNFSRKLCSNLTYNPDDFAIKMDVKMNENTLYENQISAKNPRPICVPLPVGNGLDLCIKLFNIFTPGRNIHLCMDFQARIQKRPILILHFDCMRMGQNGVALLKPEDNGGIIPQVPNGPDEMLISELTGVPENPPVDTDYDPVSGLGGEVLNPVDAITPDSVVDQIVTEENEIDNYELSVIPTELPDKPSVWPQYSVKPDEDFDSDPPQVDFNIYDEVTETRIKI